MAGDEDAVEALERQVAEMEALLAIFEGDEEVALEVTGLEDAQAFLDCSGGDGGGVGDVPACLTLTCTFPREAVDLLQLSSIRISLPRGYPSDAAAPDLNLGSKFLVEACQQEADELLDSERGQECLFQVVSMLKEAVQEGERARSSADADAIGGGLDSLGGEGGESRTDRPPAGEVAGTSVCDIPVTSGEPFTERKSTFQAHLACVHSYDEVERVMDALLSIKKIAQATHNIMAYRIIAQVEATGGGPASSESVLQDFDDDGEAAAGGRLLHMLQAVKARNCVVVVSRWYGGVKLGPSRFAIINNVARQLLQDNGYVHEDKVSKKKK
mmetsp:Transcript_1602/g.4545  ORF Transcript_1602/g.4545 Transcript_1602/m.4545 type:complete len:328 (+) Transcript_1602:46-1029(+)